MSDAASPGHTLTIPKDQEGPLQGQCSCGWYSVRVDPARGPYGTYDAHARIQADWQVHVAQVRRSMEYCGYMVGH